MDNINKIKLNQLSNYINALYNNIDLLSVNNIISPSFFTDQDVNIETFENQEFFDACNKLDYKRLEQLEDYYYVNDYYDLVFPYKFNSIDLIYPYKNNQVSFDYNKDFIQKINFIMTFKILHDEINNINYYLDNLDHDIQDKFYKLRAKIILLLIDGLNYFRKQIYILDCKYSTKINLNDIQDYADLFNKCHEEIHDNVNYWHSNYPLSEIAENIHDIDIVGDDELENIYNKRIKLSIAETNYIYSSFMYITQYIHKIPLYNSFIYDNILLNKMNR